MTIQELVRAGLSGAGVLVAACGSTPTTPGPPGDTTPPVVTVAGTSGELRGTFSASANDAQSSITAHLLYLNGTLVRSGNSGSMLTVIDTALAPGSYTVRGEATSSGGIGSNSTTFTVTAPAPPTAANATSVIDEAATGTLNLLAFTTGQATRTLAIQPPAALDATLANGILTFKALDNGATPWDDVNGAFTVPYSVTDGNGTASGVIAVSITPQPDLTFTLLGLKGEPYTGTVALQRDGLTHQLSTGMKVQAKTGANTWRLVKGQVGLMNYAGIRLEGETLELPLNNNLEQSVETLTSVDRAAVLIVFPNNYPEYSGVCRAEVDIAFPTIPADTHQVVKYTILTSPYMLGANPLGNISMAVGGQSYNLWRQAYDSLVGEDARAAALVGRAPRTFTFGDDTQAGAEWEPNANGVGMRPMSGSLYVYDRTDSEGGASLHRNTSGEVVSGTASSRSSSGIANRQLELAIWHDRALTDLAPTFSCTRNAGETGSGGSASRRQFDERLLPYLHEKANHLLKRKNVGSLDYR